MFHSLQGNITALHITPCYSCLAADTSTLSEEHSLNTINHQAEGAASTRFAPAQQEWVVSALTMLLKPVAPLLQQMHPCM
jgi:hypothetical protein